ncbi:MAG TPA: transposase, partial [Myxococcales bacterium]|nr:transposase [Myxococcales bacterium]
MLALTKSRGGLHLGRRRIARLMCELGLQGVSPRKFRVTTDSDHK